MSKHGLHRFCVAALAIVASVVIGGAPASAAKKAIKWKYTKGEKLNYAMSHDIDMKINEGLVKTKMNQTMDMTSVVDDVDDKGVASITQSVSRIRMKVSNPLGGDLEFDTDSKEEPTGPLAPVAGLFKSMTNAKFKVKMNPLGEAVGVEVPKEVLDEIKKVPGADQLGQMFTKEGFEQLVQQSSAAFPAEGVTEGDSWTRNLEMNNPALGGKQSVKTTYTYKGTEKVGGKTLDKVAVTMKMAFPDDAKVPGGAKITLKSQESDGVLYFDNEAGRMSKSQLKQALVMEVAAGDQVLRMEMDMNIVVNVSLAGEKKSE